MTVDTRGRRAAQAVVEAAEHLGPLPSWAASAAGCAGGPPSGPAWPAWP